MNAINGDLVLKAHSYRRATARGKQNQQQKLPCVGLEIFAARIAHLFEFA
jgi:hypothetical protein